MSRFVRVVLLFSIPVGAAGCVLLAGRLLPLPRRARELAAPLAVGVCGIAFLILLTVALIAYVRDAARPLDDVLTARGLTPAAGLPGQRIYRGEIGGYPATVTFGAGRVLKSPLLDVRVQIDAGPRIAFASPPLLDCVNCPVLESAGPGGLPIRSDDAAEARRMLNAPGAWAALDGVLAGPDLGQRELYVQPRSLRFRARLSAQVSEADIDRWLDEMAALADLLQRLPR